MSKAKLDRQIAQIVGLPVEKVRQVTSLFVSHITSTLQKDGCVYIPRFGTLQVFRTVNQPGNPYGGLVDKVWVRFRKGTTLKRMLENKHGKVRR